MLMMAGCKGKAHGHQNGRELQPQVQGIRTELGTSLVAQWLKIYLPMQGTPRTAACHASLSITNSKSLLKLMSIELVMPSNHLIVCLPFSSCPQSFPASVRVIIGK